MVRSLLKAPPPREQVFVSWNSLLSVAKINLYLFQDKSQGPVVQSVVSLTSSLRVISLMVLADSIHNILIFFAEKM